MRHRKNHWTCCWKPLIGNLLWVTALVSLVFAWISIYKNAAIQGAVTASQPRPFDSALVFGLEPLAWYWNALVFGILAISKKVGNQHCASCEMESPEE